MISVIIPVYNDEEYLYVCLNSVLNQFYQDFEVICIDDASTDSSLEILEYFAHKDSRIKILKNKTNKGPGYSRNQGLKIAEGKYISFLDADDWLSPDAFEILINKAEKDNLDLLIFKSIMFYEDSHDFDTETYYDIEFMDKFENKIFNHFDLDKAKLFTIPNNPLNKFYLKSFLNKNSIRFTNVATHEDAPFFYKVITSAEKISIVNKHLYTYRNNPHNLIEENTDFLFDNINISYLILDVFIENFQLYQYYKKETLSYIFHMLNSKYEELNDKFKEMFFKEIQGVYKKFVTEYGLYDDILENVDETLLKKFHFDEITKNI